ncbi:hypothetical protein U7230_02260 [Carboxydochorda subterranea]|uniref:Spo0E like sporulation regulatory protein n=1 Tax=Carboxydichorda subterranea TaxID=3109565 RepID=A0ABZ1C0K3_9FIRM|nr:hypothetical protein [Limnochorda sp. L945t]WRP17857.1 hypothetical protein U7230_02260 [Limnochorda sp. L945t]
MTASDRSEERLSEAESVKRRIEELRTRLYAGVGVTYEENPQLHDELDRLILRYIQLSRRGRKAAIT